MPFRSSLDCLWCGRRHVCRGPDDIEGWAQLCPDCVGLAGSNPFLRFRLRRAIEERGAARSPATGTGAGPDHPIADGVPLADGRSVAVGDGGTERVESSRLTPAIAASDLDAWYLRDGRFSRGPVLDAAWRADLDAAADWLDRLPLPGELVELAAGTGWWSPLLAQKGTLWAYDPDGEALDRARARLSAHGLRAHLHVRPTWDEPDRAGDALFVALAFGRLRVEVLDQAASTTHRWLRPGGRLALLDVSPEEGAFATTGSGVTAPAASVVAANAAGKRAPAGEPAAPPAGPGHPPEVLREALTRAGFHGVEVATIGRSLVRGNAIA